MIERGWVIRDADGDEIGQVHEVTGDENADIFDGLTIKHGALSKDKYVPSEHVTEILEGEVVLETNSGAQVLQPGMCAGFPAGTGDAAAVPRVQHRPEPRVLVR